MFVGGGGGGGGADYVKTPGIPPGLSKVGDYNSELLDMGLLK